jgi:hypothetical protein
MFKKLDVFLLGPCLIYLGYFVFTAGFYSKALKQKTIKHYNYGDLNLFIESCAITFIIYSIPMIFILFPGELFKVGIQFFWIVGHTVFYSIYCVLAVYCLTYTRIFIKKITCSNTLEVVLNVIIFII